MKLRTIEDIKSKDLGFKPFAKFINMALADGHIINNIKEYYTHYYCDLDGIEIQFQKDVKDVKGYYKFTIKTVNMIKELKNV